MKTLSKSVIIMFLYDALIFGISSYIWYAKFNLTPKLIIPTVLLILATGLFSLFLKANYKIREFNNTSKNCYLLFEGVIFSQIPAVILLAFFSKGALIILLCSSSFILYFQKKIPFFIRRIYFYGVYVILFSSILFYILIYI